MMTKTVLIRAALTLLVASAPVAAFAQSKPAAKKPAASTNASAPAGGADPTLLAQFGDWGAYKATQDGERVCFVIAKPAKAATEPAGRNRDPGYMFVSSRPGKKVKNEISVIVGYPQKADFDATATIGSSNYTMYTQAEGAWVKNAAEEAQMVDSMRKGADLVVKSESGRGTKTTDTYSLKGFGQAIDKVAEECK